MKRINLCKTLVATTLLGGIFAATSFSANAGDDAGKSRTQVKAELAEASRTGDMIGNYASGKKLYEMHPGLYPDKS